MSLDALDKRKGGAMKILLTGGAGYVGSVLVPELLNKGHQVRVFDNLMHNQASLLPYFINTNFEFVRRDIRDSDAVSEAVKDVDLIIHLAAIVGAPACRKDERLAEEVNYLGTVNIDKCRDPSQGIIFASTGSNYGAVEGICTEESPLNPLSAYGVTKTKAERHLLDSGNAVVYRFATAFGVSPRMRMDLFVNDMVFQALRNQAIIMYEKHFRRTFIHVKDMARGFVFAVENYDSLVNNVFNVGHESMNYTKEDIVLKIKEKLDFYLHFADVGSDPDQRNYDVSYQKIREKGFETIYTLQDGIEELIKAYQIIVLQNPYSNVE